MKLPAERRKWLVDRLRKVAAEEEAAGAKEIAAEFLKRAREVEGHIEPDDESTGKKSAAKKKKAPPKRG
jgi:hypothetical protein